MSIDTKASPLVILAFDAGDPDFIERWVREDYLPTIASIMNRGFWGRIGSPEQMLKHGCWLSLFSGISHSQHGYYYFRQLKPGTYDLQVFTPRDANAQPFWSYLHGRGKKVAIIDAPEVGTLTGLPGIQLANWATQQPSLAELPAFAEPAGLLQDVRRVFGPQMRIPDFSVNSSFGEELQIYRRILQCVEKKWALCRYLLAQDHFNLMVFGFDEAHTAAQRFWNYRPGSQGPGMLTEKNELTHAIREVYQAIDRQMGLLLAQLPGEANVFIVSSTGMDDHYPTTGLIEAFCRKLGYQAPPETDMLSFGMLKLFRRMVPEAWRVAISHHLPMKVQECLLADHFRNSANWRRTTAFAIPSLYTSFVRVNLRGREPEGIVEPGGEYKALLDRLVADLRQLVDPHTGKPAVEQVVRAANLFHYGPHALLPDLIVKWRPHFHFMSRLVHPRAELRQRKPYYFRNCYHSVNGFIVAAGPSIKRRGAVEDVSLLDLAPTFLTLMGEPIPQKLIGQVMVAIKHR